MPGKHDVEHDQIEPVPAARGPGEPSLAVGGGQHPKSLAERL